MRSAATRWIWRWLASSTPYWFGLGLLVFATDWIFPTPMIVFLDSIAPGHGRELTYEFLTASAVCIAIVLTLTMLIRLVGFALERIIRPD